ncbi:gliding motility-associated C-terminal domain-containing protein [Flavobacterium paronense]|uniref:Gliding motility-associated C-terminal domain-containing protein n=1 Tax=Flavobacterium paronense TaxID=1392775 RepID=A0ABV5GE94_9FLAO|nr:gliding motility-associated C-terminal domain-containing protein [Flavobacterium paronense]MDN3678235.1 gliding motility-associated C-terminal domain-containing protein [Flavobacterium paronense]
MKKQLITSFRKTYLILFLFGLSSTALNAQILTNGNFESGGSGNGFLTSDYTLINPLTGTSNPGFYARTTNPALMNSTFNAGGDHTTGTGNMLVFDGATAPNRFIWTAGSTGGTVPGFTIGQSYVLSYWVKSVSNQVTGDATRANISAFFVNATNINPAALDHLAPLPAEGWQQVSYSFVPTATNVLIRLKTISVAASGNDFAIDDVSVVPGALPFTGSYVKTNPTCPSTTDGSITVTLAGGFLPYGSYNLTGTVTQTNTNGIFSNLPAGTYTITATDSNNQVYTQSNIVLTAPNDLVISGPVTICAGQSTQLSVSGGLNTYTWTASPADASLVSPNSATPTVSPTVTTTYTATSGAPSNPANLVENGDFSSGISGFTTEYTQVDNPNPFGVQTSYNIVTNPAAWFTPFSSCGDHTTGTGYMMAFDGAIDVTGNVKAWCTASPITVQPNKSYTFSYYVASISSGSPAKLEVTINGVSLGAPVTAPFTTCTWTLQSFTWNSGANTTANICIYDREFSSGGNDFAIDDISLKETVTCIYTKTVTVTVTPATVPTFTAVAAICSGAALTALPTTSNNGITGTWAPALNNTATTTYTFTPSSGTCTTTATLQIVVNQPVTPTFTAVAAICTGTTLNALPTTSNNGIAGSWSPALNNAATTAYTFTPTAGQCAVNGALTIQVTPTTTPTFTAVAPICTGDALLGLPTTSNNSINGLWSPALNNTATTTYTFTPDTGQCAATTTLSIQVNALPQFTISGGCSGLYTLSAIQTEPSGSTYAWYSPSEAQIGTDATVVITTPGIYSLVVTQNGCSDSQNLEVLNTLCGIQKGISVNNDGLNDDFDLAAYNVTNLTIFNRYGMKVYTKSNYNNEWHGQSDKGDELPDGTYYYVINFQDTATKTGWIYINRAQ